MEHGTFARIWRWAHSAREVALTFGLSADEARARAREARDAGLALPELPADGPVRWFVARFAEGPGHAERFVAAWGRPHLTPAVVGLGPATAAEIAAWLRLRGDSVSGAKGRMPFVN